MPDFPGIGAVAGPTVAPAVAAPDEARVVPGAADDLPLGPRVLPPPPVEPVARVAAALPAEVALGAYASHAYDEPRPGSPARRVILTVFGPIPSPEVPGRIFDLNDHPWLERFPDRFVVGDGGRTRAMIGVDQRPGTPLDRHLERIIAQIPRKAGVIEPEDAIQFVTQRTLDFIGWAEGGAYGDGRATLPWDRQVNLPESIFEAFNAAAQDAPGLGWRDAGARCKVVPLERWIDLGLGYCIQHSLLAALVLQRVGVKARVVSGAIDQGPGRSSGHTWVELLDGRVIDPGWRVITPKILNANDLFPNRFWVSDSYRFENTNFPYLVLD